MCQKSKSVRNEDFVGRVMRGTGAAVLILGLAACSSAPDWAKPSLIYGEDASEAAAAAPRTEKDFPELADVPDAPRPYSSEAERAAIADGLANDRARARYTDEVLRGGTEPPAPAPVTSRPAPVTSPAPAGSSSEAGTSSAPQAATIPTPSRNSRPLPNTQAPNTQAPNTQAAGAPVARGAESEGVSAAPLPAPVEEKVEALPATSSTRAPVAAARPPVAARPAATPAAATETTRRAAVPAVAGGSSRSAVGTSQTYTQTRPSGADARSSNVASTRAVAPASEPALTATPTSRAPVVTHSRDTFEASRAPAIANEALEAAGSVVSSRYGKQAPTTGSADPEDPVEVNLDALRGAPGPGAALQTPTLRRIANSGAGLARDGGTRLVALVESRGAQGGPGNIPPYVVSFANGSTSLNVTDRHLIAEAADIALNTGRVVRVVGHASGIASNVDARARLANFGVSMDRATAVANELIRQGVPGGQVIVEAKGANEPAFYETAPNGEAGNRRAEIFIE